jgi:hypothetical protein
MRVPLRLLALGGAIAVAALTVPAGTKRLQLAGRNLLTGPSTPTVRLGGQPLRPAVPVDGEAVPGDEIPAAGPTGASDGS